MSCWETIADYGLRSIGIGERLLPREGYTLCQQFTLIGSGMIWNIYFGVAALVLLLVVLAGGFWDKRFWCQYVCPSGALFGLLGHATVGAGKAPSTAGQTPTCSTPGFCFC